MQSEISRLRAEASRPRTSSAESAKVQELDQWMNSVKSSPVKEQAKDHLFSVRGGWMHFNDNRDGTATLGLQLIQLSLMIVMPIITAALSTSI